MKTQHGLVMPLALLIIALLACGGGTNEKTKQTERSVNNTTAGGSDSDGRDQGIGQIEQALNGQKILYSWRQGEVLYGTYFFEVVHYCNLDHYLLFGQSEKKTVLDNVQRSSWQEEGRWDVIRYQGQLGIHYQPTSGNDRFVPLNSLPDGRIYINGVSITQQGQAECK